MNTFLSLITISINVRSVTLALADNSLTGWLPDSLGDLENLKVLTLGDNFLTGTLPSGVCELGDLDVVNVDCAEQGCECCTSCSSTEAPTSYPSSNPTTSPSTSPPTLAPVSLFEPTSPPVLAAPTISPVDCLAEISVEEFCFAPSANIGVSLRNCNERKDDWVGELTNYLLYMCIAPDTKIPFVLCNFILEQARWLDFLFERCDQYH